MKEKINLPAKLAKLIDDHMKSENKFVRLIAQFIGFGLVGVLNTGIYLVVYYIVIWINKDLYIIGGMLGFIIGTLNAYYWNSRFVFKSQKPSTKESAPMIKTFIVYGSTFLLSTLLLFLLVEKVGVHEKIAPLLNLIVTVPLNFILIKCWALRPNKRRNTHD